MLPLGNIMQGPSIKSHSYADDMQPDETELFAKLQTCVKDIKTWILTKLLLLKSNRMEVIAFGPKCLWRRLVDFMSASSTTVRNCELH